MRHPPFFFQLLQYVLMETQNPTVAGVFYDGITEPLLKSVTQQTNEGGATAAALSSSTLSSR